jgi:glycosyltransferase involved in cell wall biosynthesis
LTRRRLIVVGPLPPPAHGVTISTSLVLQNPVLRERFDVEHLDTSDHRAGRNVGTWDRQNVWLGISAVARLARRLRGRRGIVYLPLSQSTPGFVRDSLLIRVAHRSGWSVAGHLRGSDFRAFYARSNRPSRRWIRRTMSRLDSVAVMGDSLRWVLEGLVPLERITAVPNGTPEPAAAGATRDPERVLFLSNLRRRKGVVEAIDAALIVLKQRPSARFTFAGEWESRELESELRARTAAARSSIEIRPPVHGPEKDALLASSSVLLFPPVEPEGHPRVVLEALASGLPVVTTDRGAILETVIDGQSGFVLDEPDSAALAERIATLLDDGQLRARMGRAARDRYLERYTQEAADRALADWLEGLP